jgi:hypothetical protein
MKLTKLIAACCLSFAGAPLFAQSGFDFGLKGIVQTSSLLNSTDQAAGKELNFSNKVTGGIGVAGGYSFTEHLGVELNILYSKQTQGYTGEVDQITQPTTGVKILSQEFQYLAIANQIPFTGNYTASIAMSCIKIPILFRYTGDNTKKKYFSSFIGPQINMINAINYEINGQKMSFSNTNVTAMDLYKKTTIDAVLGVGMGFNLSDNISLSWHLRLDYGLGDVEDKSFTPSGSNGKIYDNSRAATHTATGGLLISVSYKLVHKNKEVDKTKSVQKTKK